MSADADRTAACGRVVAGAHGQATAAGKVAAAAFAAALAVEEGMQIGVGGSRRSGHRGQARVTDDRVGRLRMAGGWVVLGAVGGDAVEHVIHSRLLCVESGETSPAGAQVIKTLQSQVYTRCEYLSSLLKCLIYKEEFAIPSALPFCVLHGLGHDERD